MAKHEISDSVTFQAVCSKGDYFGPYESSRVAAETDAGIHNSKPGCENHIVKIVKVSTVVKAFANK